MNLNLPEKCIVLKWVFPIIFLQPNYDEHAKIRSYNFLGGYNERLALRRIVNLIFIRMFIASEYFKTVFLNLSSAEKRIVLKWVVSL